MMFVFSEFFLGVVLQMSSADPIPRPWNFLGSISTATSFSEETVVTSSNKWVSINDSETDSRCCKNEHLCKMRYAGARLHYKSAGRDGLCEHCAEMFFAREGDDVTMTCEACDPQFSVKRFTWTFKRRLAFDSSVLERPVCINASQETVTNSSVMLSNVSKLQNGLYECFLHSENVTPCAERKTAKYLLSQEFHVCGENEVLPDKLDINCVLLGISYAESKLECSWNGNGTSILARNNCNISYHNAYSYRRTKNHDVYRYDLAIQKHSCTRRVPKCRGTTEISAMVMTETLRVEVNGTSGVPDWKKYSTIVGRRQFKPAKIPRILPTENARCLNIQLPLYYFYSQANSTLEADLFIKSKGAGVMRRRLSANILPSDYASHVYTTGVCGLVPHTTYEIEARYKIAESIWSDRTHLKATTSADIPSKFHGEVLYLPNEKYVIGPFAPIQRRGENCRIKLCGTSCTLTTCDSSVVHNSQLPIDGTVTILPLNSQTSSKRKTMSTKFRFSQLSPSPTLRSDWIKASDDAELLYTCVRPFNSKWDNVTLAYCESDSWDDCRKPSLISTHCGQHGTCHSRKSSATKIQRIIKDKEELCFELATKHMRKVTLAAHVCFRGACTYAATMVWSKCSKMWNTSIEQSVIGVLLCLSWDPPCLAPKSYNIEVTRPTFYGKRLKLDDMQHKPCGFGRFGIACNSFHTNDSIFRIVADTGSRNRLYSHEEKLNCSNVEARQHVQSENANMLITYITLGIVLAVATAVAVFTFMWYSRRQKEELLKVKKLDIPLDSLQHNYNYIDIDDIGDSANTEGPDGLCHVNLGTNSDVTTGETLCHSDSLELGSQDSVYTRAPETDPPIPPSTETIPDHSDPQNLPLENYSEAFDSNAMARLLQGFKPPKLGMPSDFSGMTDELPQTSDDVINTLGNLKTNPSYAASKARPMRNKSGSFEIGVSDNHKGVKDISIPLLSSRNDLYHMSSGGLNRQLSDRTSCSRRSSILDNDYTPWSDHLGII